METVAAAMAAVGERVAVEVVREAEVVLVERAVTAEGAAEAVTAVAARAVEVVAVEQEAAIWVVEVAVGAVAVAVRREAVAAEVVEVARAPSGRGRRVVRAPTVDC